MECLLPGVNHHLTPVIHSEGSMTTPERSFIPPTPAASRSRLTRLGLRRRSMIVPAQRADATADEIELTGEEHERLNAYHATHRRDRRRLLERARQGDRVALLEVYLRFGLRLPLAEEKLTRPLPWMRKTTS